MAWTEENGITLCRQITVHDPFVYKTGSREREMCLNKITKILNTVKNLWLKVAQRNVPLKIFHLLKNSENIASGIGLEYKGLDELLSNNLSGRKYKNK